VNFTTPPCADLRSHRAQASHSRRRTVDSTYHPRKGVMNQRHKTRGGSSSILRCFASVDSCVIARP
jgi:hypothetical protein